MGKALPKLLEKALASGARVVVRAANDAEVEQLNKELWTYTTKVFLPHGSKADGFADRQPIYLTAIEENPNNATILAFTGTAQPEGFAGFERCLYMFDGNNPTHVSTARQRWKQYKETGCETVYWKQNTKGGWEQGAA